MQLSDLQLIERLNTAKLLQLEGNLPGSHARQALTALADLSAFLSLPPAEIPPTPAPDLAEQRRIMALTITYVSKTLHQLPNFSATRITTRFQDQPQGYEKGGSRFVPAQPLAQAGSASATVFYRDGGEVVNASLGKRQEKRIRSGALDLGRVRTHPRHDAARCGTQQAGMGPLGAGRSWPSCGL